MRPIPATLILCAPLALGGCFWLRDDDHGAPTRRGEGLHSAMSKSASPSGSHQVPSRPPPRHEEVWREEAAPSRQAEASYPEAHGAAAIAPATAVAAGSAASADAGLVELIDIDAEGHVSKRMVPRAAGAPAAAPSEQERYGLGLAVWGMEIDDREVRSIVGAGPVLDIATGERLSVQLRLGLESYQLRSGSTLDAGTDGVTALSLGGDVLYHLNDRHAFISPFVSGGLAFGGMMWSYRNTLVASDGSRIDSDSLGFFQLQAAVGLDVGRNYPLSLRCMIGPALRAYDGVTREGFDNDLIEDSFGIQVGASLLGSF